MGKWFSDNPYTADAGTTRQEVTYNPLQEASTERQAYGLAYNDAYHKLERGEPETFTEYDHQSSRQADAAFNALLQHVNEGRQAEAHYLRSSNSAESITLTLTASRNSDGSYQHMLEGDGTRVRVNTLDNLKRPDVEDVGSFVGVKLV